jgi:hypothetical protein
MAALEGNIEALKRDYAIMQEKVETKKSEEDEMSEQLESLTEEKVNLARLPNFRTSSIVSVMASSRQEGSCKRRLKP